MRILHTGDWHLGKRLGRFSRLDEQREIAEEICEIAERETVDVVLLAGDVYDVSQPPVDAVDLLGRTMERLADSGRRPVVVVAGNHDSPAFIDAHKYFAQKYGVLFYGFPHSHICPSESKTVTRGAPGFVETMIRGVPLRVLTTPYANEQTLGKFMEKDREAQINAALRDMWTRTAEQYCDKNGVNVLLTHLYFHPAHGPAPLEPDGKEERTINYVGGSCAISTFNVPPQIQYCAVGHLHRYQILDGQNSEYGRPVPVVYSGSPLAYSMSEAEQEKYVLILEIEPGTDAEWKPVALTKGRKLARIHCATADEALKKLKSLTDAYVEIVMTGHAPLSSAELNELHRTHPRITEIIPAANVAYGSTLSPDAVAFHSLTIEEHFVKYYEHKYKAPPDQAMLDIFRRLTATRS
jgi:exonuclease SbcD